MRNKFVSPHPSEFPELLDQGESLLNHIQDPADLEELSPAQLIQLAGEIREQIIAQVSTTGGHLSANLGVVELTIAIHRVFHSPKDKIVWDVGHQCYAHKLLTGRFPVFGTLRQAGGMAGFPKREESPHDAFNTGHASTAISAALGILTADRLAGTGSRVVAVVGDGALTGGMAYEALAHAGQMGLPLIVILNDNKMAIGPTMGSLSKYLSRLSMKGRYQLFRRNFDALVKRIPWIGDTVFRGIVRLKRAVKAIFYSDNFFVDLGFEYVGPIQGHSIQTLENVLQDVRLLDRPVVVHVITQKGKGYPYAEANPDQYHGVSSFSVDNGIPLAVSVPGDASPESPAIPAGGFVVAALPSGALPRSTRVAGNIPVQNLQTRTFTDAFCRAMLDAGARDQRVIGITAAMEKGTGLGPFKTAYPSRFFDVGIAEEHAVTFAAGLAAQGMRPVVAVYSTFMQRAVDQVIHDVAIQRLPVVFALDRAGFVSDDGETHQGLFDIALFRPIPNLTLLAPAGYDELGRMLDWALASPKPVLIRYPKAACPVERRVLAAPLELGRGTFVREWGVSICLAFTGSLYAQAWEAADLLRDADMPADLYNLRFLKPVDDAYLVDIMNRYELVVCIEEGVREGGFGEYAAELALRRRCTADVLVLAAPGRFMPQGKRDELLARAGLDGKGIAGAVIRARQPTPQAVRFFTMFKTPEERGSCRGQ